jgi:HEAT repeat protein
METESINSKIIQYFDRCQDTDYLADIVNSTSISDLCQIIDTLLRSSDHQTVDKTCLFIRDLATVGSQHPDCVEFLKEYKTSSIVKTLEQLLFLPNHFVRKQSIYTLGKTGSDGSINVLNQAFFQFRDTDPILLPRLIAEMRWLGSENIWELLDSMISSPIDMTRWAVIATLSEFIGDDARVRDCLFQRKFNDMERLRSDPNPFVQAEAEYEYQLLKLRSAGYNRSRAAYKTERNALERQYKPKLSFDRLSIAFTNYLCDRGSEQYSIAELEAFLVEFQLN